MARHSTLSNLSELCTSITDPRINRRKLHSLESIITISVCAVICGAESWNDIEDFGILKKEFFESFLDSFFLPSSSLSLNPTKKGKKKD